MRLNHTQGAAAEDAAWAFLQSQNCTLIARNWHCPYGEIDLIVQQGQYILFVEVKYRKSHTFGGAAYSISPSKLSKISRSVEYYLQQHQLQHAPCRIDAILLQANGAPEWLHNITG